MKAMELVHLEEDVQNMRDCFRRRKTRSDIWRRAQLERLGISKRRTARSSRPLKRILASPQLKLTGMRTVGVAKKSLNLSIELFGGWNDK
ncbi:hypothetical protein AAC387_Pa06g3177 [Persea americana]